MEENILSENEIVEEIPGEILEENPGEIVEELPQDNENFIVEELPEDTYEDIESLSGEELQIISDDILEEENENELLEEEPESQDDNNEADPVQAAETDQTGYEEEILSYLETLTTSSEIIQQNCKTGIENLQLLSTCSVALQCMILGGIVIFCYLNRLG